MNPAQQKALTDSLVAVNPWLGQMIQFGGGATPRDIVTMYQRNSARMVPVTAQDAAPAASISRYIGESFDYRRIHATPELRNMAGAIDWALSGELTGRYRQESTVSIGRDLLTVLRLPGAFAMGKSDPSLIDLYVVGPTGMKALINPDVSKSTVNADAHTALALYEPNRPETLMMLYGGTGVQIGADGSIQDYLGSQDSMTYCMSMGGMTPTLSRSRQMYCPDYLAAGKHLEPTDLAGIILFSPSVGCTVNRGESGLKSVAGFVIPKAA